MNTRSNDTLYEKVVRELKTRIMSGVYKKGDALPSEKELIETMGVSRITVRRALSILADAGLIETSQGRKRHVIFDAGTLSDNSDLSTFASEYVERFRSVGQIRLMIEPAVAQAVASTASEKDIERLVAALSEIRRNYKKDQTGMLEAEYIRPEVVCGPQQAFYAPKKSLPIDETEGRVCSEFVMCYPPGIPILAPGELITKEILAYIHYAKDKGCSMTGPEDMEIRRLNVMEE